MRKLLTWAALLTALLTLAGCAGKEPPEPKWEDPLYRAVVYNSGENESDFLYFLFIKAELKQGSDKPLFYAVLGIPVYMPVFNGGDSDSLAVMA